MSHNQEDYDNKLLNDYMDSYSDSHTEKRYSQINNSLSLISDCFSGLKLEDSINNNNNTGMFE